MRLKYKAIEFLALPAILWLGLVAIIFRCPQFRVMFGHKEKPDN